MQLRKSVIFAALLVCFPSLALAGGFQVRDASLQGRKNVTSSSGDPLRLCIFGDAYLYSGSSGERSYLLVYVKHKSIPSGVINKDAFGEKITFKLMPIPWRGGQPTSSRTASDLIFRNLPRQNDGTTLCSYFTPPKAEGEYYFEYDPLPLFTHSQIGQFVTPDTVLIDNPLDDPEISSHVSRSRAKSIGLTLRIINEAIPVTHSAPEVYLKVNGHYPASASRIVKSGFSEKPVKFEWVVEKAGDYEIQHRFRLFQVDSAWSHWTNRSEVSYSFIFPGGHFFRVETRYRRQGKLDWEEAGEARYAFNLDKPFVSGGLSKGRFGSLEDRPAILTDVSNYYTKNRALVLSVSDFDHFTNLPYTILDRDLLAEQLSALGFEVSMLDSSSPSSAEIETKISDFVRSIVPGERAIVYFSTHGFQDEVSGTPYLASKDCDPKNAFSTCISLSAIELLLKSVADTAQHLLVIADACSAGIGTLDKAFYERAILDEKGAHFITAGLANQVAQIDQSSGQSVFTAELLKGLSGAADANEDGVISLLEIFHHTRTEVSRRTNGEQVPSIGRLKGSGEMMFGLAQ